VRIDSWQIEAFGPLADWEETDLARHDLFIVLGANESGKSTLFEFLTSVLFGFSPARAQDHPYKPWSGKFPAGALEVVLADDRCAHIARRLTSRAEGRLSIDGIEDDLANRPVPWVGQLSRAVFKNVHALTQDEAFGLDQRAWQAVQDRVLGGSSYDFLRPSLEVVDDLESRRTQYWRPDRRGKPQDRQILDRIRELRGELAPAQGRRTRIEAINADLTTVEEQLHEQEGELHQTELALERDAVLAPLLRRVDRMRDLDRKATALVASDELSADVTADRLSLSVMCSDLADEIGKLESEVEVREHAEYARTDAFIVEVGVAQWFPPASPEAQDWPEGALDRSAEAPVRGQQHLSVHPLSLRRQQRDRRPQRMPDYHNPLMRSARISDCCLDGVTPLAMRAVRERGDLRPESWQ